VSAFDPWSIDYFSPPTPHVPAPSPKAKAPKPVPDEETLFMLQRHALQILNDIEDLKGRLGHHQDRHLGHALQKLETDATNTYKVIRRYLAENVAPAQGDFSA
jgi:hypothetical protein